MITQNAAGAAGQKAAAADPQRVMTGEFRLSFPYLFKPRPGQNGQAAKYTAELLFPKTEAGTRHLQAVKKAAMAAAIDKWGADQQKWPKGLKWPFVDGDQKQDLDGYPGHFAVKCSSKTAPGIVNQRMEHLSEKNGNTEELYAGCYCHAELRAYAWAASGNVGVSVALENIQKTRDGDAFSGKKSPEKVFTRIDAEDDPSTGNVTPVVGGGDAAADFPF